MQSFDRHHSAPQTTPECETSPARVTPATTSRLPSDSPVASTETTPSPAPSVERPILTFQELAEHRMDDLRQLYQASGVAVGSDEHLLQLVRHDWKLHRQHIECAASPSDGPSEPTPVVIDVGGRRYHMFGVSHSWTTGNDYRQVFESALAQFRDVVSEQGMRMYFRLPPGSVSCADWAPLGTRELLTLAIREAFDIRGALGLIAGLILPFQRREAEESTTQQVELENEVDGLPDQVAREVQVAKGLPLDFIQRRSQYQAEFARHAGNTSECALLVGGLHATEIRDYLKYGVEDEKIRDLAKSHATMARENPYYYKALYAYYWARCLGVGIIGTAIGISPWVAGALGLHQWLMSL